MESAREMELEAVEAIQKAFAKVMSDTAGRQLQIQEELLKVAQEKLVLYQRRTEAFERIAQALEYQNERKFHTV